MATEERGRSRAWCGTYNNYTPDVVFDILNNDMFTYAIVGKEVGESGTPHLQIYVRCVNPIRLSSLTAKWPRAHWEIARGSPRQNIDYCSKQGEWLTMYECNE